jgi:uncharacterized membrane protein YeiH
MYSSEVLLMEASSFHVPVSLDYAATLAWAVTGALLAVRRGLDIVGAVVIALVSALGGGLLRDGLFLQQKPVAVTSPFYLPIVALAVLVVVFLRDHGESLTRHRTVDFVDALGMGAFAVVGMEKAMAAGFTPWGAVLTGMVNALGGGVLRDILLNEVPAILKPSQFYALPVLVGCLLYLALSAFTVLGSNAVAWITVLSVFAGRLLTMQFDWRTSALSSGKSKRPPS